MSDLVERLRRYHVERDDEGELTLMVDTMREAADEIERLRDQHRWIPVSGRLPDHNSPVIARAGTVYEACYEYGMGGIWVHNTDCIVVHPTHWMPLPEVTDAD